jgi:2'-5' RNA ligase
VTPAPANGDAGDVRCFLALVPDTRSVDGLQRLRNKSPDSSDFARGIRWVDPASLHLTLRFFGDATLAQVEYLKHMLPALVRAVPAMASRRCAIWPNRACPRLLVLELDAPDALLACASECEALARKAGFDPEPRAFKAHLTLARLRPACTLATPAAPAGMVAFESLALIASDLQATGARYRILASIALPAPAKT